MARYSIDGQILTDMADGVRNMHKERQIVGPMQIDGYGQTTVYGVWLPGKQYKAIVTDLDKASGLNIHIEQENSPYQNPIVTNGGPLTVGETSEVYFTIPVMPKLEYNRLLISLSAYGSTTAKVAVEEVDECDSFGGNHTPQGIVDTLEETKPMVEKGRMGDGLVNKTIEHITADQLKGVGFIGPYGLAYCRNLKSIDIPEGVIEVGEYAFYRTGLTEVTFPSTVKRMHYQAFQPSLSKIKTITLLRTEDITQLSSAPRVADFPTGVQIRVPGALLSAYKNDANWAALSDQIVPLDAWVGEYNSKLPVLVFGETITATIPLVAFDYVPDWNMSTEGPVQVAGSCSNTELSLNIATTGEEGDYTINITVIRNDGVEIPVTLTSKVIAELIPGSYTVENVASLNAAYGFDPIDVDGVQYYESTCQGMSSQAAFCRVYIHNPSAQVVKFKCINYAEANYDYGLFGKVNVDCSSYTASSMESNAYFSFKGKSKETIQEVVYTDAVDDCFIDVMFRKDGSGDNYNDSLRFYVEFE